MGEKDLEPTSAKCPLRNSETVLATLKDTKTQCTPVGRGYRAVTQNTVGVCPLNSAGRQCTEKRVFQGWGRGGDTREAPQRKFLTCGS